MADANLAPSPPPYQPGRLIPERTRENDQKALVEARIGYDSKLNARKRERNKIRPSKGQTAENHTPTAATVSKIGEFIDDPTQDYDPSMLDLMPIYDQGVWQKPIDAERMGGSGVGYPFDESLIVENLESQTHINHDRVDVEELRKDILDIRSKALKDIAGIDPGSLTPIQKSYGRTIETAILHKRKVTRIIVLDADVNKRNYGRTLSGRTLEKEVDKACGKAPRFEVENYVAAHIILRLAGKVGNELTEQFFQAARNLAQQQLALNPELAAEVERKMTEEHDGALQEVLAFVNDANNRQEFNPYHQAKRDEWAIEKLRKDLLLHITGQDIILCFDKNGSTIATQLGDAFERLLEKSLEGKVMQATETYSTLHPGPLPDVQRHGVHWSNWLLKHPELDCRNPANDCRLAKSVVYHFCYGCETAHKVPEAGPHTKDDSSSGIANWDHVTTQQKKFIRGALAVESAILKWIFRLVEPELYEAVTREISAIKASRGEEDIWELDLFAMIAVLVNAHTTDHKDKSDWMSGFAGLVAVGEYEGADLLLRELGLLFEAKSGTAQLIRGRELRHSIGEYTGRRFCSVFVIPEGIRVWAEKLIKKREEEAKKMKIAKGSEKTLGKRKRGNFVESS